ILTLKAISVTDWQSVSAAPFDRDLEVCVIDKQGEHLFPHTCRQTGSGWVKAATGSWIHIDPTHWREWIKEPPLDSGPNATGPVMFGGMAGGTQPSPPP